MKKTKQVPEPDLETKVRWLLNYEHRITVDSECEFGDHWYCSCGKSDLDSYSGHLTEEIMALIKRQPDTASLRCDFDCDACRAEPDD